MSEPRFLSRAQIDTLHDRSLTAFGGSTGMRDENGLESALAAAANVWLYEKGDCFEIAAAYAFHLAEAQSFLDGNKRTAIAAALTFLAMNGRRKKPGNLDLLQLHDAMIKVADHKLARTDLAEL